MILVIYIYVCDDFIIGLYKNICTCYEFIFLRIFCIKMPYKWENAYFYTVLDI
jgi:hypothetical protein